jgi:hypothetical protein
MNGARSLNKIWFFSKLCCPNRRLGQPGIVEQLRTWMPATAHGKAFLTITTSSDSKEQPMKKPAFVPRPDLLETRIALSGGTHFTASGAAILSRNTLSQTYGLVQKAFTQYMKHGQNLNRLEANLASAVSRIPFNYRDGLRAAVVSEAVQMKTDIRTNVAKPVASAVQRALNDVHDFVKAEIASGTIVVR